MGVYRKQIVHVLECVPPPMLLLFKTNDCLRHAERQLGAGVDSFLITLRFCLRALLSTEPANSRGGGGGGAGGASYLNLLGGGTAIDGVRAQLQRLRLRVAYWLLRYLTEPGCEGGLAVRTVRSLLMA